MVYSDWTSDSNESAALDEWNEAGTPTTIIIKGGEIEDHLISLKEVEPTGMHKTKYALPYENNLTIFIGRGLKRTLWEIREINKIFI